MILELLNVPFAFFVLRVALGLFFIAHGYTKLFRRSEEAAKLFSALQYSFARPLAHAVGWAELFGGILLVVGLWTQIAALFFSILLLTALFRARFGRRGFVEGWELEFLAFAISLALVFAPVGDPSLQTLFIR